MAAGGLASRNRRHSHEVRLKIGLVHIEVDYLFRNVTDTEVTTTVAFPLPLLDWL